MENHSCFLGGLGYFGYYPDESLISLLLEERFDHIVDLTCDSDNLDPYFIDIHCIKYPIRDGDVPGDFESFMRLIFMIACWLERGEKVYIHCRGGHGRSGLVSAAVLCAFRNTHPRDAITVVTNAHWSRKNIRNKWKKMQCPHHRHQRTWLFKHFNPVYFGESTDYPTNKHFSTTSSTDISLYGSRFSSVKNAFETLAPYYSPQHISVLMFDILRQKYTSDKDARYHLLSTFGKPFIYKYPNNFWGTHNDTGLNIMGDLMSSVRRFLVKSILQL
jgi:predicted NAD-dependent protein-ADP-ribosyltransferase YbiA (DUF1768 family)